MLDSSFEVLTSARNHGRALHPPVDNHPEWNDRCSTLAVRGGKRLVCRNSRSAEQPAEFGTGHRSIGTIVIHSQPNGPENLRKSGPVSFKQLIANAPSMASVSDTGTPSPWAPPFISTLLTFSPWDLLLLIFALLDFHTFNDGPQLNALFKATQALATECLFQYIFTTHTHLYPTTAHLTTTWLDSSVAML